MGQIDNLNDPYAQLRDMRRQQRRAAHATPGNNMSIGRDGLRVYGGGSIVIDNNGGITITGPDGQIIGQGTLDWTGPANLNGPTTIAGALDVSGPTTLNGDLTIGAGGQIDNGGTILRNGSITGTVIQITGTSVIFLTGNVSVSGTLDAGATTVNSAHVLGALTADAGLTVNGQIVNVGMPFLSISTHAPNVWYDPNTGKLYQVG